MAQIKKRERASNFEKSEIRLLTDLVTKYRSVIENKKTDAVTNKDKDEAWASTFNAASSGSTARTMKALKLKYESLKKGTKKKMTLHRQELYKTGGGPSTAPDFDDVEEKVLAICSNISGLDARNDCDNISDIVNPEPDVPKLRPEIIDIPYEIVIDEVTKETGDIGVNEGSEFLNSSCHEENVNEIQKGKWSTWKPGQLKSKISIPLKCTKSSVTAKIDKLSEARLELVQLQIEIAKKEHAFIREEHELKMLNLQNEEMRKEELHRLMLNNGFTQ